MFKKMFPEWGQYRRVMTLEEYHRRMDAFNKRFEAKYGSKPK